MAEDDEMFSRAVENGLKLAKRVYAGKDRQFAAPPRPAAGMERSADSLLPTAPMVYAVISDPAIVDNPDIPSYQPHVYGRCDPPVLIPLQMGEIGLEVDCLLDTAFVAVRGRWRVHCVMRNKSCDCRLVVPMGEKGSVLGVEVEVGGRSYYTQVIELEDHNMENTYKNEGGGFLKPQMFFLTIPQVNGGSDISVRLRWSQKLIYSEGHFIVTIPFNFPEYITPFGKIFLKREKIHLNINTGIEKEVMVQKTSHPLKEKSRQAGKLRFLYEANVESWSNRDFEFSFGIYSNDIFGGILLKSPTTHDTDQRDMFCLYLFPGSNQKRKAFKNEVVFLVDVSGSMHGKPIENVKSAIAASLLELKPGDRFDIIAFSDELRSFSSCLEPVTEDVIENAIKWMDTNFTAEGGTDIMHPVNEAIGLLSSTENSIPQIFLITDGAVDGEQNICHTIRTHLTKKGSLSPRISTFGIGSYCNHYFLKMLASIGRGQYAAAYDADSIANDMQKWFHRASSTVVANITVDIFSELDDFEVYPIHVPDLSAQCPLIISGRYHGKFQETLQAKGILADMNDIVIDLKVQGTKDFPLEKALAKQHIDLLTAQAWLSESKQLEEKVTKLSIQSSIPSEYTCMVLQTDSEKQETVKQVKKKLSRKRTSRNNLPILVRGMAIVGFGDITATMENCRFGDPKEPETHAVINKAVGCCNRIAYCCCCACCIRCCSKMNDQFVIVLTQLCASLSCLACSECCTEFCCDGE
ncbi:inter-alpha-trypsin inhibitor heavy chain H3-like [Canna indica]|uniref:Inter-alpha-trypsin inhibitor heavy chain H3-like n=1 Tax=Canna indica TaxID=4628 RepID=A0AAQ3Q969_9LILI|nr:inter-alpha-trypsin inhibitor heavy chain H3-like [Canna indica]